MIVSLHVATGAAAGSLARSRLLALLLGPTLHLATDRIRHQDIASQRLEIISGSACLALIAARRGALDPATIGAASSAAPDLEHVLPWLRPRGKPLFHRYSGPPYTGGVPVGIQLLFAGTLIAAVVRSRKTPSRRP